MPIADSAGPTAPCPSATTGSGLVAGALKQQHCWSSPRRSPHRSISRRSCASPCTTGEALGWRPEQPFGSARRARARRRQVALDPAADDIDRIGLLVGGELVPPGDPVPSLKADATARRGGVLGTNTGCPRYGVCLPSLAGSAGATRRASSSAACSRMTSIPRSCTVAASRPRRWNLARKGCRATVCRVKSIDARSGMASIPR